MKFWTMDLQTMFKGKEQEQQTANKDAGLY